MSDVGKAVFLSYASQDAQAAKRIADALRAAGVEVWFDAEGGLEHGDEWDRKIRRQIKECVLFIAVISANTQAREEGYFRIEWDLAAERARGIASGVAFILPVVIDDTKEPAALVPDRFRSVQWTRLRNGEIPPEVLQRFLKLWSHRAGMLKQAEVSRSSAGAADLGSASPDGTTEENRGRKVLRRHYVPVAIGVLALALVVGWYVLRGHGFGAPNAITVSSATPLQSEAQHLVAKVRDLLAKPEMARAELAAADEMCKRASVLDPTDAEVWAAWSNVHTWYLYHNLDSSSARQEAARDATTRAMQLNPQSYEARFAQALWCIRGARASIALQALGEKHQQQADAERLFRELLAERPEDARVLFNLGFLCVWAGKSEEGLKLLEQAAANPAFTAIAWQENGWYHLLNGRYREAEAANERSIAAQPYWNNLALKIRIALEWYGDVELAKTTVERLPLASRQEDWGVGIIVEVFQWRREPGEIIRFLEATPTDWLRSNWYTGPAAVLLGEARTAMGQQEAARRDYRRALALIEARLADDPNNRDCLRLKVQCLYGLGEQAEAEKARRAYRELRPEDDVRLLARFGPADDFFAWADKQNRNEVSWPAASFRIMPLFDPMRADPRFARLQAQADADPRLTPNPKHGGGVVLQAIDDKSVAVLAFANLSDDKANEYFSDGISEELLNVLAKVPNLKVAARTSSFYFKGRNEPIPEIAQKLGVAYVVEGSVRKAGNKVRITAQLIKAADGFHVWSETYDRDLTDIFAVQDEIAKNILGVVKGSLLGEGELPHATTTNIEAYTLYLQAQGAFAKRGDANLREAIRLFEAALAVDPDYVPALVGLAQARELVPIYANLTGSKADEMMAAAKKAARRALELDPRNATAHTVVGWAMFQFEWRWSEGLEMVLRARELAPNSAWISNSLGDYWRYGGDYRQSLAAKQRAWELDPLSPVSHWDLAYTYQVVGDYDQTLHWSELAAALAPHNLDSYIPGILVAMQTGHMEKMRQLLASARREVHENEGMLLLLEARAAIAEKNTAEARRILVRVEPLAESGDSTPAYLGYLYLLIGESEQAARWLRLASDRRDGTFVWPECIDFNVIAANPVTRPILDQPGLKELYELRQRNARAGLNKL
jgi:TolB-like protein/Tfp pilus assembly protein PilF